MRWPRPLRVLGLALGVLLALAVLSGGAAAWLVGTHGGLAFAAWSAQRLLGARLTVQDAQGRLLGPLRIGRLTYRDADHEIGVDDLELHWTPRRLLDGELSVQRLRAGSVLYASRQTPHQPPPASLTSPVAFSIEQAALDQLHIASLDGGGVHPLATLSGIGARATSDGRHHRLDALVLSAGRIAVTARATLDGAAPFAVSAAAQLSGDEAGHPFTVALDAGGTLRALQLDARSTSGPLQVSARARGDAFAEQPLHELTLSATGLDPSAWAAAAPHARLSIEMRLAPVAGRAGDIAGEIRAGNGAPGRWNDKRVPLRRFASPLRWSGRQLVLDGFDADLGRGRLTGSAHWTGEELIVDARARDIDAAAWHRALRATRLSGELAGTVSARRQTVRANLADPRFRVVLNAAREATALRIDEAKILARGASLDVHGQLAPDGAYRLDGRLANFDPALFVDVPRARLNATLGASGKLTAHSTLDLNFELHDSRVAGHAVGGRGRVLLQPERLERADVHLVAGDNRLDTSGALGRAGDALQLRVDAPRLEQIGFGGSVQGSVTLSGALRAPGAQWSLRAPRLALPDGYRLTQFASDGRYDPNGAVRARLSLARLDSAQQQALAADVSADIDGTRMQHTLSAAASGGQHRLEVTARGGLDQRSIWNGRIERAELRGPYAARLAQPATLRAGRDLVVLQGAALSGERWSGNVDLVRWEAGRLQSRGRFTGLPAQLLLPQDRMSTTLTLGGEWNVDMGERLAGNARVFREQGDIVVKANESLPLGLQRLQATLQLAGRRAELTVDAAGTRAGSAQAHLAVDLALRDGRWGIARSEPWRGDARLAMPSIAWLGPALGEGVAVDGRVQGVLTIAGTPAAPATSGSLSGNALSVRLLEYGLDLGGGVLQLDLADDVARVRRLEFVSVASQPPLNRRIDYTRLAARPGQLSAQGELALKSGAGRVDIRAERLAVSQLRDRWLMVSGSGALAFDAGRLGIRSQLKVDGAHWELAPAGMPTLSSDVVVTGRGTDQRPRTRVEVDATVDLGDSFYFYGAGIDSRLAGQVHLLSEGRALRATGSVRTVGGTFDAYGKELAIERGILNFQGLVDNPGLNVRAVRKNLPVEAGVEVGGTLKNPSVRLVSDPDVPDTEKLSWMVLGRAPDQSLSARDADLLLSAATALRGNRGGGPLRSLMQGLGLEELGVSSGTLSGYGRGTTSRVVGGAGFGAGSTTAAEQIATVGKRIGSNAVLSYERSLTTAESVVKLTVSLSRRLSLVGRVGADNAVDVFYTFTFGGERKP